MATRAVIVKELNNLKSWVGMGRATGRSEAGAYGRGRGGKPAPTVEGLALGSVGATSEPLGDAPRPLEWYATVAEAVAAIDALAREARARPSDAVRARY